MGFLDFLTRGRATTIRVPNVEGVQTLGLDDGTAIERALDQSQLAAVSGSIIRQSTPPLRGSQELLQSFKQAPWLRAPLHKVGFAFAGIRWSLYARKGAIGSGKKFITDKHIASMEPFKRRAYLKAMVSSGDITQLEDHPFLDLFDSPNEDMTGRALRHMGQIHMDLLGETFLVINTDVTGRPTSMWILPPTWVQQLPTPASPFYEVNVLGSVARIPRENVVALRDPDPANPYGRGAGIGMSLADEIDADEYAAKHVVSWFHNKAMPDMLVSLEGANQGAVDRAKAKWEGALRGAMKQFRTHWTGAKLQVQRLDTSFKDMRLLEIRKYERDTIIQCLGVPPEQLGIIEQSNRSTSDASRFIFAENVLIPRLELWRTELQFKLINRFYDERLILEYESPIPDDAQHELAVASAFPEMFSIDEIRAMANRAPLEDGTGSGHVVDAGKTYVSSLASLAVQAAQFHVAAGAVTYDELRGTIGLPAAPGWGKERAVAFYVDPATGEGARTTAVEAPVDGNAPLAPEANTTPAKALRSQADVDAFMERQRMKALGAPQRRTKNVNEAMIAQTVSAADAQILGDKMLPMIEQLVKAWGEDTINTVGDKLTFSMLADPVTQHLQNYVQQRLAELINVTTRNDLEDAMKESLANDGGDPAAMQKAIRDAFDAADIARSQVIAETEVRRSSQFAAKEAMSQSGIVTEAEWLATHDGRARDEHMALDGQRQPLDTPFTVKVGRWAGAQALYPGSFGIAALDINCRCVVGMILPDDEDAPKHTHPALARARASGMFVSKGDTEGERAAVWRALDDKLVPWEARLHRAVSAGFHAQERAVLDKLNSLLA